MAYIFQCIIVIKIAQKVSLSQGLLKWTMIDRVNNYMMFVELYGWLSSAIHDCSPPR